MWIWGNNLEGHCFLLQREILRTMGGWSLLLAKAGDSLPEPPEGVYPLRAGRGARPSGCDNYWKSLCFCPSVPGLPGTRLVQSYLVRKMMFSSLPLQCLKPLQWLRRNKSSVLGGRLRIKYCLKQIQGQVLQEARAGWGEWGAWGLE